MLQFLMLFYVHGYYSFAMSLLGWLGTISYLLAYFLLSIGKLCTTHKLYHVLNIVGAAGLICNAFYLKDDQNIVINTAWAAIAFYAIYRNDRKLHS